MILPTMYGVPLMLLIAGVKKCDVFTLMQNTVDSYPQKNKNGFDNNSSLIYSLFQVRPDLLRLL